MPGRVGASSPKQGNSIPSTLEFSLLFYAYEVRGVSSLLVIEEFLVYLWKIGSLLAAPAVCVGPLIIHRYFLPHHASASAAVAILVHDEPRAASRSRASAASVALFLKSP